MRAAGGDGTVLFDQYHRWVNLEAMLEKCFIGYLVPDDQKSAISVSTTKLVAPSKSKASHLGLPMGTPTLTTELAGSLPRGGEDAIELAVTAPILPVTSRSLPRDWYQSSDSVTLAIYVREGTVAASDVSVQLHELNLSVSIILSGKLYRLDITLPHQAQLDDSVRVTGKTVSITLKKVGREHWSSVGTVNRDSVEAVTVMSSPLAASQSSCSCSIIGVSHVSSNVRLFTLENKFRRPIPAGHHIDVSCTLNHRSVMRPYTPIVPLDSDASDANEIKGLRTSD